MPFEYLSVVVASERALAGTAALRVGDFARWACLLRYQRAITVWNAGVVSQLGSEVRVGRPYQTARQNDLRQANGHPVLTNASATQDLLITKIERFDTTSESASVTMESDTG
jgi:hypothetical protein